MKRYTTEELAKLAQDYKKSNPKAKKMYATEDGNFFFDINPARNHARAATLPLYEIKMADSSVKPLDENGQPVTPQGDKTTVEEQKDLDPVAEAKKKLLGIDFSDLETVDYYAVLECLTTLEKTAESRSKEHVLAAGENLQKELKAEETE